MVAITFTGTVWLSQLVAGAGGGGAEGAADGIGDGEGGGYVDGDGEGEGDRGGKGKGGRFFGGAARPVVDVVSAGASNAVSIRCWSVWRSIVCLL